MSREISEYVYKKYCDSIVDEQSIDKIADDIRNKIKEIKSKYPRCKVMKYDYYWSPSGTPYISLKPTNQYNVYNCAFIITATLVCHQYLSPEKGVQV